MATPLIISPVLPGGISANSYGFLGICRRCYSVKRIRILELYRSTVTGNPGKVNMEELIAV